MADQQHPAVQPSAPTHKKIIVVLDPLATRINSMDPPPPVVSIVPQPPPRRPIPALLPINSMQSSAHPGNINVAYSAMQSRQPAHQKATPASMSAIQTTSAGNKQSGSYMRRDVDIANMLRQRTVFDTALTPKDAMIFAMNQRRNAMRSIYNWPLHKNQMFDTFGRKTDYWTGPPTSAVREDPPVSLTFEVTPTLNSPFGNSTNTPPGNTIPLQKGRVEEETKHCHAVPLIDLGYQYQENSYVSNTTPSYRCVNNKASRIDNTDMVFSDYCNVPINMVIKKEADVDNDRNIDEGGTQYASTADINSSTGDTQRAVTTEAICDHHAGKVQIVTDAAVIVKQELPEENNSCSDMELSGSDKENSDASSSSDTLSGMEEVEEILDFIDKKEISLMKFRGKPWATLIAHSCKNLMEKDACECEGNNKIKSDAKCVNQQEKNFRCNFKGCEKSYARHGDLKIHQRSHTGERPYSCDKCPKRFTANNNLRRHLKVHLGVKPYRCETCPKKFMTRSCLKRHQYTHDKNENSSVSS